MFTPPLDDTENTGRDVLQYLSPLEDPNAYKEGRVDVQSLPFRVQFNFEPADDTAAAKAESFANFQKTKVAVLKQLKRHDLLPVNFVDESLPDQGRYCFYLTPKGASKDEEFTYLFERACMESGREPEDCQVVYGGDAMTDLRCCDAAPGADLNSSSPPVPGSSRTYIQAASECSRARTCPGFRIDLRKPGRRADTGSWGLRASGIALS